MVTAPSGHAWTCPRSPPQALRFSEWLLVLLELGVGSPGATNPWQSSQGLHNPLHSRCCLKCLSKERRKTMTKRRRAKNEDQGPYSQHAGTARLLLLKGRQNPARSSASHRPDRKGLHSGSPTGRGLVSESNSDLQSAGSSRGGDSSARFPLTPEAHSDLHHSQALSSGELARQHCPGCSPAIPAAEVLVGPTVSA